MAEGLGWDQFSQSRLAGPGPTPLQSHLLSAASRMFGSEVCTMVPAKIQGHRLALLCALNNPRPYWGAASRQSLCPAVKEGCSSAGKSEGQQLPTDGLV